MRILHNCEEQVKPGMYNTGKSLQIVEDDEFGVAEFQRRPVGVDSKPCTASR